MESRLNEFYDVAVAGAGPAGISAARTLAASGFKTLVVEKESLPGRKTCAGYISAAAWDFCLERFGEPDPQVLADPPRFRGYLFCFDDGLQVPGDLSAPGYSLNRATFDHWLGRSCGAPLIDGMEVTGLELERFHARLILNGGASSVDAVQFIAADGAASSLLEIIRPEFYRTQARPYVTPVMVLQMQAELDWDPAYVGLVAIRGLRGLGRVWMKNGLVHLAVRFTYGRGWESEMAVLRRYLEKHFGLGNAELETRLPGHMNLMGAHDAYCFGAGSALLVGEASGLINGWGEGIYAALRSGEIAGTALVDSAGERITPHLFFQSRIAAYGDELRREFSRSHELVGGLNIERVLGRRRLISLLHRKLR